MISVHYLLIIIWGQSIPYLRYWASNPHEGHNAAVLGFAESKLLVMRVAKEAKAHDRFVGYGVQRRS